MIRASAGSEHSRKELIDVIGNGVFETWVGECHRTNDAIGGVELNRFVGRCSRSLFVVLWILLLTLVSAGAESGTAKQQTPLMVLVRGGSFAMGDEHGDLWNGCRPVHTVTLTYDFTVGQYPVTFAEYDAFTEAIGRPPAYDHGWGRDQRPVIYVSWWDAINYCNWLSDQAGLPRAYSAEGRLLDSSGEVTTDITQVRGYRLLTEAEWEYAASGGQAALPIPPRSLYAGSDVIDDVAWYSGNSGDEWVFTGTPLHVDYSRHGASLYEGKSSQPVGLKEPNELGIYDMSGNVFEWCHDYYAPYEAASIINPIGAAEGHVRVMRGGSWIFGANDCRVACRLYRSPHDRIFRIGFRVAQTRLPDDLSAPNP